MLVLLTRFIHGFVDNRVLRCCCAFFSFLDWLRFALLCLLIAVGCFELTADYGRILALLRGLPKITVQ